MMRGLEPTMLRVPPRIAANPIGIRSRDAGVLVLFDILKIAGKNRAADPTFCMKVEITPTTDEMTPISLLSSDPAICRTALVILFTTPALSIPLPRIMIAAMETTALLPRPDKA